MITIEDNTELAEGVLIGDNTIIRRGTVIKEGVEIGKNCQIGNNCLIREHVILKDNVKIGFTNVIEPRSTIGENSSTQSFCTICENSVIGKNVFIGPNFTNPADNSIGKPEDVYVPYPAIIEDDCRIGANVTITPGRIIRKGSIIGAGSLVTKDTEPKSLYYGAPAKKIENEVLK